MFIYLSIDTKEESKITKHKMYGLLCNS